MELPSHSFRTAALALSVLFSNPALSDPPDFEPSDPRSGLDYFWINENLRCQSVTDPNQASFPQIRSVVKDGQTITEIICPEGTEGKGNPVIEPA